MARVEHLQFGANQITVEDDVTAWIAGDLITVEDVTRGHEVFTAQHERYGYVLVLAGLDKLSSIPAGARKVHSQWQRERQAYFIVGLFGGGLVARTLVRLVLSAGQMVASGDRTRFQYFATEAEARGWLANERQRVQALITASPSDRR